MSTARLILVFNKDKASSLRTSAFVSYIAKTNRVHNIFIDGIINYKIVDIRKILRIKPRDLLSISDYGKRVRRSKSVRLAHFCHFSLADPSLFIKNVISVTAVIGYVFTDIIFVNVVIKDNAILIETFFCHCQAFFKISLYFRCGTNVGIYRYVTKTALEISVIKLSVISTENKSVNEDLILKCRIEGFTFS